MSLSLREKLEIFWQSLITPPNDQVGIYDWLLAAKCLKHLHYHLTDFAKLNKKLFSKLFLEIDEWLANEDLLEDISFLLEDIIKPNIIELFQNSTTRHLLEPLLKEKILSWWDRAPNDFKISLLGLISDLKLSSEDICAKVLALINLFEDEDWDIRVAAILTVKALKLETQASERIKEYLEYQKTQIIPLNLKEAKLLLKLLSEELPPKKKKQKNYFRDNIVQNLSKENVWLMIKSPYWIERKRAATLLPHLEGEQQKIFQILWSLFREDSVFMVRLSAAKSLATWASKNKAWPQLISFLEKDFNLWKKFSTFTSTPFYEKEGYLFLFDQQAQKETKVKRTNKLFPSFSLQRLFKWPKKS